MAWSIDYWKSFVSIEVWRWFDFDDLKSVSTGVKPFHNIPELLIYSMLGPSFLTLRRKIAVLKTC